MNICWNARGFVMQSRRRALSWRVVCLATTDQGHENKTLFFLLLLSLRAKSFSGESVLLAQVGIGQRRWWDHCPHHSAIQLCHVVSGSPILSMHSRGGCKVQHTPRLRSCQWCRHFYCLSFDICNHQFCIAEDPLIVSLHPLIHLKRRLEYNSTDEWSIKIQCGIYRSWINAEETITNTLFNWITDCNNNHCRGIPCQISQEFTWPSSILMKFGVLVYDYGSMRSTNC